MKWFLVSLSSDDISIASQKTLFRIFFKLLIDEEFPSGLAMHQSIEGINKEIVWYFSVPEKYYPHLKIIFEGFSYQEISEPNLESLKTLLGVLD